MKSVPLSEIAYARSGDKGNSANVGLIAFTEAGYQFLKEHLTEDRVLQFFDPLPVTNVVRYELPNLLAFNFILQGALGKGGSRSLAIDAQGKALGQALLSMQVEIESSVLEQSSSDETRE